MIVLITDGRKRFTRCRASGSADVAACRLWALTRQHSVYLVIAPAFLVLLLLLLRVVVMAARFRRFAVVVVLFHASDITAFGQQQHATLFLVGKRLVTTAI